MASIKAKNVVALIVMGIGLLVTLSACENSKYAEVMGKEDLRADGQTATVPDTDTQTERQAHSDQTGGSFDGQSIDEELLGLSAPLVFAPEPPPSPASDYVPDSPPQVFRDARVSEFRVSALDQPTKEIVQAEVPAPVGEVAEKTLLTEEPVAEPEVEIAKLDPSDFVSEAPEPPLEASRVETGVESELADVFFDFDQYAIRSNAIPVLEKNAELLKETYTASNVLIEGHCDERGTGEYNLELGKRRAQAIKGYLIDLGVEASRIQIASYGKEKPFCAESTPRCWQNNRRGHFVQRVLRTSLSK